MAPVHNLNISISQKASIHGKSEEITGKHKTARSKCARSRIRGSQVYSPQNWCRLGLRPKKMKERDFAIACGTCMSRMQ